MQLREVFHHHVPLVSVQQCQADDAGRERDRNGPEHVGLEVHLADVCHVHTHEAC